VPRLLSEGDVGAELGIEQRCVLLQRALHVGHDRQWLEVQFDQLQRIASLSGRLGNQHGNRLADVAHAAAGEDAPLRQRHAVDARLDLQRLQVGKVRGRPDGNHPGRPRRGLEVDPSDRRVREMGPQEDRVQATRRLHVIDVPTGAANQVRIFHPPNGRAKNWSGHCRPVYGRPAAGCVADR